MGRRIVESHPPDEQHFDNGMGNTDVAPNTSTSTIQARISQPASADTYIDRLVKYLPADVIVIWILILNSSKSMSISQLPILLWFIVIVFLVLTFLWIIRTTSEPGKPPAVAQASLSTLGMLIIMVAIGPPFDTIPGYMPLYGQLFLITYTLITPLFIPGQQT
jgi:hypothetical protein